jgi:hypothetical protein
MIDVESLIVSELDRLLPPSDGSRADWQDVLARSNVAFSHARSPVQGGSLPRRAHRLPRLSDWRLVPLLGFPLLAGAIAILVLAWPFSSSPSVLDRAAAAIGTRPITHIVMEDNLGSFVLDLHTGKRTPATSREDFWYGGGKGWLIRTTFLGTRGAENYFPPSGGFHFNTYVSPFPTSFAADYANQLRTHALHVIGSGAIGKTPVYWIEGKPLRYGSAPTHTEYGQIAISKKTFKPVYVRFVLDGRVKPGSGARVLSIETQNTMPHAASSSRSANTHSAQLPSPGGPAFSGYPIKLTQALAMRPRPVIPKQIDGLRLAWIGRPPIYTGSNHDIPIPGVWLYYGTTNKPRLLDDTQPSYKGAYAEIFEFPHANSVTRFYTGRFPANGDAVINALSAEAQHTATIKAHNRYYVIHASSDDYAIAAARAVAAGK